MRSANPVPIVWTTHRLKPEQIAKVDSIFHQILWLDMIEVHMLTQRVNERLGLVVTPKHRSAIRKHLERLRGDGSSSAAEGVKEAVEEAPKLLELKLVSFDAKSKIKVIKEVRSIAGLGLKEAKELVESAPKVLMKDLKAEQAEELQKKLQEAGATVELS